MTVIRKLVLVSAVLSAAAFSSVLKGGVPGSASDAPRLFPDGPGRETVARICSGCHTPDIAARQRLSPVAWKKLVDVMADHGAVATDQELAEATTYLSKSFPDREPPVSPAPL